MSDVAMTIKLGREIYPGRIASIQFNGITVFSEIVYDNELNPGERNIILLFASRLKRVLEDD